MNKLSTNKSTGPTSKLGKEKSSMNAMTHGCRSKSMVLLEDETEEEYLAVRGAWEAEFRELSAANNRILERLIESDWKLQRTERRFNQKEAWLVENRGPMDAWGEAEHAALQLMQRYLTTNERQFYKAWYAVKSMRAALEAQEMRARTQQAKIDAQGSGAAAASAAEKPKIRDHYEVVPMMQTVVVRVVEGKTITKATPSTEDLWGIRDKFDERTIFERKLWFEGWVPEEYEWVADGEDAKEERTKAWQTLTLAQWLKAAERELSRGGHLGPVTDLGGDEGRWG